jgi:hypothetical protein
VLAGTTTVVRGHVIVAATMQHIPLSERWTLAASYSGLPYRCAHTKAKFTTFDPCLLFTSTTLWTPTPCAHTIGTSEGSATPKMMAMDHNQGLPSP